MNDSNPRRCPTCGTTMDAGGVSGCPRCLMLAALQPTRPTEGADRPAPPALADVRAAFPQLEVLEFVGQGGMGCVFKARQRQLQRVVALKILPETLARDPAFTTRFTREAQALAALDHPNIVTIHDFGQTGGFFYLLMEFVDGVNLRQALRAGHFSPEQALAIVPPLCDALQFAHDRGIVHRDIKPENLLLDHDGRIKIADFGIAKMLAAEDPAPNEPPRPGPSTTAATGMAPSPSLTGDHGAAGTPGYMAPEQAATPRNVDRRADIYSLGVVFYEMLTGELPSDPLQPPSRKVQVDVRLDEIVLRALEKAPERRYQTAADLRTQVETLAGAPPKISGEPTEPSRGPDLAAPRHPGRRDVPATSPFPGFLKLLVPLGAFLIVLFLLQAPGPSRPSNLLSGALSLGALVFGIRFGLLWMNARRAPAGSARISGFGRLFAGLLAYIVVVLGAALWTGVIPARSDPGVSALRCLPVGTSNQVVIVDVSAVVEPGGAELQVALEGPRLTPTTEAALAETFFPPFAGTFVVPTQFVGNRPWRILSAGEHSWRLGFVLPDAALARQAFENLRTIPTYDGAPGQTFDSLLFEVRSPGGDAYRASLKVMPPVTSGNPDWVNVYSHSAHDDTGVRVAWTVNASRPGTVSVKHPDGFLSTSSRPGPGASPAVASSTLLLGHPDSNLPRGLHAATLSIELTRIAGDRVRQVTRLGGATAHAEFAGNFRELSAELLGARNQSFKTVRGAEIELCRFQGKPLVLTVDAPPGSGPVPAPVTGGTRGVSLVALLALFALCLLASAGILLLRRSRTAGRVLLLVVAVPLLLIVLGVATLLGFRMAARSSGQGLGASRTAALGSLVLESSHPSPQPHPPGLVQQTQNGFRLALPASRLATFEFSVRQADDAWLPVPALSALVATGTGGRYSDSLWWTLRRGNDANGTNQLWFWNVGANQDGGRPLPQLADHATNITHHVPVHETLDWWQLALPPRVAIAPRQEQTLVLFRTFGTETVHGRQPKEARITVRCEPLPPGLPVVPGRSLVRMGLDAQTLMDEVRYGLRR